MGRLFDNPLMILAILLVIVLLFGAPKLPGMARSLGQSMRIFKSEVKEMKDDGRPAANESTIVNGETVSDASADAGRSTGGSTAADSTASTARDADGSAR